jgi:hypothetical protein
MRLYVEGIGLCGPGLDGWGASRPVLAGTRAYVPAPTQVPPSALLPPNERRRAALIVKLALAVGAEAFAATAHDPAQTASVFASSGGDGETIHEIMTVLASPARELSPTRFHNSVHNASAGYWSIASRSRAASSSLCCHDDSFAAGLLEAAVQVMVEGRPVVLVAYDVRYPFPLSEVRPMGDSFAVGMVLAARPGPTALAQIDLELAAGSATGSTPEAAGPDWLQALCHATPVARSLPLLAVLATGRAGHTVLSYLDDMHLTAMVTPLATSP